MKVSDLKPKAHSKKEKTRVGRGNGSGKGTYSTYGCKGQRSRSGGVKAKGFEGGQTPIYRRLPKYKGFKPLEKEEYIEVNVENLEKIAGTEKEINLNELFGGKVKVLGRGEISIPLVVKASKFSKQAKEKIEKAQGKVEVI
ncbi:50S ribosomal protein L15 [Caldisericum exile]|uniref:Large ribosomal subunit protein uL15 n=1 Tax=Caldisericum exile (strain DSM 21853 / NBRC 104410 / AZM16c01) TaxID=511051 RepID=A0A7U6GF49_CALEA|nr:50S ribosomal protein L15 [Caldisericum exile]BAL81249.1 50S ribosomal protein L15 [Caldisericum exile AZM16c01]